MTKTKTKTKSQRVWLVFYAEWRNPVVAFSRAEAHLALRIRPNATMRTTRGTLTWTPPAKAKKQGQMWTIRCGDMWWAAGKGNGTTDNPDKVWRMSRDEALRRAYDAGVGEAKVVKAPPAKAKRRTK